MTTTEYTIPPGQLDYDHNRLYSLTAMGEKGSRLQLEVFRGRVGFAISQENKPMIKIGFQQSMISMICHALEKQLTAGPGAQPIKISLTKYDIQTKTSTDDGAVVIGRDDKNLIYIGVWKAGVGQDGKMKFPLRLPLSVDVSADIDAVEQSVIAAKDFITVLNHEARTASVLSSWKRRMPAGGAGGGRFGGGGARGGGAAAGSVDDAIMW